MKYLEKDLRAMLASKFRVGELELVRVTWDTPAAFLEKIVNYERVRAVPG